MAKFKFKFGSVKKVKEAFEKKAQKELALIDLHIDQHEHLKLKLFDEVNSIRKSAYNKKIPVAELRFISQYKSSLHNKIKENDQEIKNLEKKRNEKVEEVIQKTIEKKMLVKLEQNHFEEFTAVENKNELKDFDELAVQKFARTKKMKTILLYVLPFVLAFALVTGLLMYLNSNFQNIFGFDFSPKTNLHLNADSTKTSINDSLKTQLSDEELKHPDSLKTDSTYAENIKDSVSTELYTNSKNKTENLGEQKNAANINIKKLQNLTTMTKPIKLDSLKNYADKQISFSNKNLQDTAYVSWLKNVSSIYEAMEPKKAAKIIQNYSDNVARDILYAMKKKTAAKIVAELNPELANRIFRFE